MNVLRTDAKAYRLHVTVPVSHPAPARRTIHATHLPLSTHELRWLMLDALVAGCTAEIVR